MKNILPDAALREVREISGEFRRRNYDLTLPWEEGYRLLTTTAQEAYESDYKAAHEKFWQAVEAFGEKYEQPHQVAVDSDEAKAYIAMREDLKRPVRLREGQKEITLPSLVDQAKEMHNGTFNAALYPEWKQMRKHFGFAIEYSPVPRAAHFITNGIAKDTISAMREDLESRNQQRVKSAVRDTYTRLMTPVSRIAETLGSKDTIFRDSLIGNVREIVGLIPMLNLTGDAGLTRLASDIETRFANLNPDELRNDVGVRREATKAAKELVSRFGAIGKRRFA
jgi:hypothetical protein